MFASTTTGRRGLQNFCSVMDLPKPVTSKPYKEMMKLLSETFINQPDAAMHKAASKLAAKILMEQQDRVDVDNNGNMLYNVAMTVDGTWQRRGHCSKIGVVFIISISTGEVLDYAVKS